jgi:DNA gyrase subunit B
MELSKTDGMDETKTAESLDLPSTSAETNGASGTYSEANIRVLEGIEAIRLRPSMYVGDTGVRGLHHLVYEVVDNSIDEALAGYCRNIAVTVHVDGSVSIADDGRGIPVGPHHQFSDLSTLEVVLTKPHAGGKFDHDTYKVSGGLHGVGVTAVNALSEWLEAEIHRDGHIWRQDYKQGEAQGPIRDTGPAKTTGTTIRFLPDAEIFDRSSLLTTSLRSGFASWPTSTRESPSPSRTSAGRSPRKSASSRRAGWLSSSPI